MGLSASSSPRHRRCRATSTGCSCGSPSPDNTKCSAWRTARPGITSCRPVGRSIERLRREIVMRGVKSQTLYWMAITFVLFPLLILLGIYMRSVQAGALGELQGWFYPMLTLHGVGMVGVWYVASMGCVANVLSKYVSP